MMVVDVMMDLDKVYMIELNMKMFFVVLMDIYKSGFIRIFVYEGIRLNIVGILFMKDLIFIDLDDEIELFVILVFYGGKNGGYICYVSDNMILDKVFFEFKTVRMYLLCAYFEDGLLCKDGLNV